MAVLVLQIGLCVRAYSLMCQAHAASLWAAYVGPRRALLSGPRWWLLARVGGKPGLGRADASMGCEIKSSFIFPLNLLMLI